MKYSKKGPNKLPDGGGTADLPRPGEEPQGNAEAITLTGKMK